MRRAALLLATVLVGLFSAPSAIAETGVALPNSIASTGDSITRAYDSTSSGCFLSDCPEYSWSTGTAGTTSVNSHYLRILTANSRIRGNAYDDARTGAGAVVTKDVPAGKLAVGVPARIREPRPTPPPEDGSG